MSEDQKLEFAEALSIRYIQLIALTDATRLVEDSTLQNAEKELHRLRTIILELPEDILALVKQLVSL